MGASLMKLTPAGRNKEKTRLIQEYYEEHCKDIDSKNEFYQAVCKTVEEINRKFGYTQIHIPETDELERLFNVSIYVDYHSQSVTPQGFTGARINALFGCLENIGKWELVRAPQGPAIKQGIYVGVDILGLTIGLTGACEAWRNTES